jgi:hypothetical protein
VCGVAPDLGKAPGAGSKIWMQMGIQRNTSNSLARMIAVNVTICNLNAINYLWF